VEGVGMSEEYVEVTLKIPKGIVELFKAARELAKDDITLEDWLCERIAFGIESELEDLNVGLEQFVGAKINIAAYDLDELLDR